MGIDFELRASVSPYIECVWRSRSDDVAEMTSIASAHWTLITWRDAATRRISAHGPETRAMSAPVPPETEFTGIRLALGTAMQQLEISRIVDDEVEFPDVSRQVARMFGRVVPLVRWFDDAEDLVHRLVRAEVIVRDPMIGDVLRGWSPDVTARTIRRHFLSGTGLTPGAVRQIERAREAASSIRMGAPIANIAHDLGFYDQPHLARSLTRFIGRTGTELRDGAAGQLSLLYKT